jgi:hypothetical protein
MIKTLYLWRGITQKLALRLHEFIDTKIVGCDLRMF